MLIFPIICLKKIRCWCSKTKSDTPRMLIFTVVFEGNSMMRLQDKNQELQECLYLLSFWMNFDDNKRRREVTDFLILSMAGTTATFWGLYDEGGKHRIRERSKMCGFSLEIQQFWHMCKINESINAAKFEYNLGNMKDCENQSATQKSGTPKRLTITDIVWRKSMLTLQDIDQALSECVWNLPFLKSVDDNKRRREVTQLLILSMARTTARFRGPKPWGTRMTQFLSLSMAAATARFWGPRDGGPKCRSKQFWAWLQPQHDFEVQAMKEESRFWTALQFGWKVPTSSLEGKAERPQWH